MNENKIKEEKGWGIIPADPYIKEPTLKEIVEHIKKHGGYLKGKGNGGVKIQVEI